MEYLIEDKFKVSLLTNDCYHWHIHEWTSIDVNLRWRNEIRKANVDRERGNHWYWFPRSIPRWINDEPEETSNWSIANLRVGFHRRLDRILRHANRDKRSNWQRRVVHSSKSFRRSKPTDRTIPQVDHNTLRCSSTPTRTTSIEDFPLTPTLHSTTHQSSERGRGERRVLRVWNSSRVILSWFQRASVGYADDCPCR